MPTWGEILTEIHAPANVSPASGGPDFDRIRRKYLAQMAARTGRPVIVYATCWLEKDVPPNVTQINLGDLQGFMETVAGIQQRQLDLLITSPGGLAEATEAIVAYLRTKFDHIRAFIPVAAMSAATMLALGADEIVMGRHSQLGPIDPQFTIGTPEGPRSAPARAILDQFERGKQECQNPQNLAAWLPILRSYAPGLLAQCVDQQDVAVRMVREWLQQYMLKDEPNAVAKADAASKWFGDYQHFGSHARRVSLVDVQNLGLKGSALEDDQALQDAVLSVHHSYSHTFGQTGAVKIIENHLGRAWVKMVQQVFVAQQGPPPPSGVPPLAGSQPSGAFPPLSRAERRRQQQGRR